MRYLFKIIKKLMNISKQYVKVYYHIYIYIYMYIIVVRIIWLRLETNRIKRKPINQDHISKWTSKIILENNDYCIIKISI